jgi:hypothetical protein
LALLQALQREEEERRQRRKERRRKRRRNLQKGERDALTPC